MAKPLTDTQGIAAELNRRFAKGHVPMPRVLCADGFSVSVQASAYTYCVPRSNSGPWIAVELGYPTSEMPGLEEYQEYPGTLETVWSFVPIEKVAAILASHGGLLKAKPVRGASVH